jgi:hypothetical protein
MGIGPIFHIASYLGNFEEVGLVFSSLCKESRTNLIYFLDSFSEQTGGREEVELKNSPESVHELIASSSFLMFHTLRIEIKKNEGFEKINEFVSQTASWKTETLNDLVIDMLYSKELSNISALNDLISNIEQKS